MKLALVHDSWWSISAVRTIVVVVAVIESSIRHNTNDAATVIVADAASTTASSGPSRRRQQMSSSSSSSLRFQYSDTDLEGCAKEASIAIGNGNASNNSNSNSNNNFCAKLYKDFLSQYHDVNDRSIIGRDDIVLGRSPSTSPTSSTSSTPVIAIPSSSASTSSSSSFQHFQNTVRFIHEHNSNIASNLYYHHKLRLNQFSDTSSQSYHHHHHHTMLNSNNNWQMELEKLWKERVSSKFEEDDEDNADPQKRRNSNRVLLRGGGSGGGATDVRLLDTAQSIDTLQHEQNDHRHRSLIWNKKTRMELGGEPATLSSILRTKITREKIMVMMPGDGTNVPAPFSSPQVPTSIHGTEVELHEGSHKDTKRITRQPKNTKYNHLLNDYTKDYSDQKGVRNNRKFSTRLNWATTYNPDGVSLVRNDHFDQGSCGSCWAISATGSVEASAARNAGRNHFVTGLQHISDLHHDMEDKVDTNNDDDGHHYDTTLIEELMEEARDIEATTFQQVKLSIQELVDCDTDTNEGCIGGNPLLTFDYIYKNGLVPWADYPYVGNPHDMNDKDSFSTVRYPDDTFPTLLTTNAYTTTTTTTTTTNSNNKGDTKDEGMNPINENQTHFSGEQKLPNAAPTCRTELLTNPIATVESWGLLHKDHEQLIEYALLYIGPVAVGFNGADPNFINYGGGIYDSNNCDQTANHALLIVGYDHDDILVHNDDGTTTTKTIRYWIARNSWGKGWGEDGFVKIKRGSGEKGIPGVCGIARSPSVALGGVYSGPDRTAPLILHHDYDPIDANKAYRNHGEYVDTFNTTQSWRVEMNPTSIHPVCNSLSSKRRLHSGCMGFMNVYESNQPIFLALIGLIVASIAITPLAMSLWREHHLTIGSIYLDDDGNTNSKRLRRSERRNSSRSLSRGRRGENDEDITTTECTHLLTLKDMYASQRKEDEPRYHKPRGRSIIMTNPEQDPFELVPSSSFAARK